MRKLTPTIARALAEKVRVELIERNASVKQLLIDKITASKEMKNYRKLMEENEAIQRKLIDAKSLLQERYSTKTMDVSVYNTSVHLRDTVASSVESIKDLILIEDYLSDGLETTEEIIKKIADQLCS